MSSEQITKLSELMTEKEKWSYPFKPFVFMCGTTNLNRGLAVSKMLNSMFVRKCSLLEIVTLLSNYKTEHRNYEPYCDRNMVVHHPLLLQLKEEVSNFAFQHCIRQYAFSHNKAVKYNVGRVHVGL